MKDNITKIVRRALLNEQGVGGDKNQQELGEKISDPNLKLAWNQGCFPASAQVFTTEKNEQVVWVNSTKVPGYQVAILHAPAKGESQGVLEYRKVVDGKLTDTYPKALKWSCAAIAKLKEDETTQDLKDFVKNVRESGLSNIHLYSEKTGEDTVNGVCKLTKLIDIINDPQYDLASRFDIKKYLDPQIQQMRVWVCGQTSKVAGGKTKKDWYMSAEGGGYRVCTKQDLESDISNVEKIGPFNGEYLCRDLMSAYTTNKQYIELKKLNDKVFSEGANENTCRDYLKSYLKAAETPLEIPQARIDSFKQGVRKCINPKFINYNRLLGLDKSIPKIIETIKYLPTSTASDGKTTLNYRISDGVVVRESKDSLKSLIRENLVQLSESKKKVLTEENNIIVNRFSVITEGVSLKTKKQKSKIFNDLVNESYNLTSQGFNQTLINEQFWDVIKSFFGNTGTGVVQMFSERIIKTILETLTPLDKDGWVSNVIIATIGNIPPADYVNGKIFSCEYISDKLSKGIVEGMVRKVQNESGMEGPIYDIIRNSMIEMAEDTEFGMKIETMIGDLICPKLSGVKEKMSKTAEDIKSKALA